MSVKHLQKYIDEFLEPYQRPPVRHHGSDKRYDSRACRQEAQVQGAYLLGNPQCQPTRNLNRNMHRAKRAKNDEFYTQLSDIENELRHYKDHFRNKGCLLQLRRLEG